MTTNQAHAIVATSMIGTAMIVALNQNWLTAIRTFISTKATEANPTQVGGSSGSSGGTNNAATHPLP